MRVLQSLNDWVEKWHPKKGTQEYIALKKLCNEKLL
jgi:hypothetical protein